MPGIADTGWIEQFCTGCRQVTWHLNGLCTNRDFHLSDTATAVSLPAQPPEPPAPDDSAKEQDDEHAEAAAAPKEH